MRIYTTSVSAIADGGDTLVEHRGCSVLSVGNIKPCGQADQGNCMLVGPCRPKTDAQMRNAVLPGSGFVATVAPMSCLNLRGAMQCKYMPTSTTSLGICQFNS